MFTKSEDAGDMAALPQAKPEDIGLDPARLDVAYGLLEKGTRAESRVFSGAALLVGRHGKSVAPRFFGRQGPEADAEPLRRDAMFLLASISKPITYMAGLLLVERGLLNLSDLVTRYIPDFAAHHKEETRVHHLYTHTSGMPDMLTNNIDLRARHAPLDDFIRGAIRDTVPLFRPGTNLSYQSMGTLIVAEIIQRITGMSIGDFLRREIFEPLGLEATALGSRGLPRERLVRVDLPKVQVGKSYSWNSSFWQELGSPWGGAFSSPEDLGVFAQLMLNGGHLGETRLFSPSTVSSATRNQLDYLLELSEPLRRTQPWGLGWKLNHVGGNRAFSELLSQQTFGHGGATGTMLWIAPELDGFCVLLTTFNRWDYLLRVSNAVVAAFV